ncbi:unnamed protein product, partial [Anisakis simplex]|uniref:DDE_Tnp_IS1595 domain-containing protein n=1 Tax=Anisakis simplex TaxID=6269 RepID=A0A0M3JZP2_ANISI
GGVGKTVEIDETVITKRKYGVGRCVRQQWIFGGVEIDSGECFLVPVDNRSAATLMPLIYKHILPGTTIVSDCWASYSQIQGADYSHLTVNHSLNFVDPVTSACTNHIESLWQKFKQAHRTRFGTHRTLLPAYIEEFVWRKKFSGPDAFYHLWMQIQHIC